MKNDSDDNSATALAIALSRNIKTSEEILKRSKFIGNFKSNPNKPCNCTAVFDFSFVSAAYEYYKYQKDEKNIPLDIPRSSSNMWKNSYALIIEPDDDVQPLGSTNDLEKSLDELQVDAALTSELPKFNEDFLNLYHFFDDQIESSVTLGSHESTIPEIKTNDTEFSNPPVVNFKPIDSDSKEYFKNTSNDSSEGALLETDSGSFETRSSVSKSSSYLSQHTSEETPVSKSFHMEAFFPEELDYEPSEVGEIEVKESDDEFFIGKEKGRESFLNYRPQVEVSDNPIKMKDMSTPEETCSHQDLINFFVPEPLQSNLQDNYSSCFEYDEDDSESEHSFKRNSNRNRQANNFETMQQPLNNDSKINSLNSVNDMMDYIFNQCRFGNINEAISAANEFIANSMEPMQLEIFKELFMNIIDFIRSSDLPVDDVRISEILTEVMAIFHKAKLFNSDLCSLIISECYGCDHTIETGKELFCFLQKIEVPVDSKAISLHTSSVIPSEIPSLELISFMEYVKYVCNLPCPRTHLSEALGRFLKLKEFLRLIEILCFVTSEEIDLNQLQDFIKYCIKNDNWAQISKLFCAWSYQDGHLISCLAQSFLFQPEDVGIFFERLAGEVYKQGDVPLHLVGILGQIGVSMMLEVSSRRQYESAYWVLFTLHKHNINYLQLQVNLQHAPHYLKSIPNYSDVIVFPSTVVFAALDICFQLKRFRDAYRIFKNFTLNLSDYMDLKSELKLRSRRFRYLLKLAQELHSIEPLKLGLQSFHDICSIATEDFSLEELKDFAEEVEAIYNKYLAYVLNGCQLHTALELFKYSEGEMKEIFAIHPQILRGLLITFAQNDKINEARKFFSLGCTKKVYNMEEIKINEFAWCLSVMSSWTIFEVELVIEDFIRNVCLAWDGNFDLQPTVQIVFKSSDDDSQDLNCLKKSHSIDSAKETVRNALRSYFNIKWVERQDPGRLELVFETICNYWINKSPNFPWRKNPRKNLLEDVRPNAEFEIQLPKEECGFKCSTESNSVKSSEKVLHPLTSEYSVADSSHQLISDKIEPHLMPEETVSETACPIAATSSEQEQIISSSNQLSSDAQSSEVSKTEVVLPAGSEKTLAKTKILAPGSSKPARLSKPCKKKIENFKITLKNSAKDRVSRVVSHAPEGKLVEPENSSTLSVPETVFQKIILFLRSKVLLKCKDLQPQQQQEKARQLATSFIQNNVVSALDKKTMKLLSGFADGCI